MRTHELNIIMTEACNASCTFCTQKHNINARMSVNRLLEIINDFKAKNPTAKYKLAFFGGEPLIEFKVIQEFLNDFDDKNCISKKITTNGILLNTEVYEYCLEKNIQIVLSYDGIFQDQRKYSLSDETKNIIRKDQSTIKINFGVHKNGDQLLKQYQNLMNEFNLHPKKIDFYFNRNYWEWTKEDVYKFASGLKDLLIYLKSSQYDLPDRLQNYVFGILYGVDYAGCGAGDLFWSYTSNGKRECGVLDLGGAEIFPPKQKEILELCAGCEIINSCPKTCPEMLRQSIKEGFGQYNAQCQIHKIITKSLQKIILKGK